MRLPSAINGHYYCGWVQSGDNPLKELLTWSIWQDRQHNVMGAQTDKFWQQIQLVRVKHFPHLPLVDPSSHRPATELTLARPTAPRGAAAHSDLANLELNASQFGGRNFLAVSPANNGMKLNRFANGRSFLSSL